MCKSKFLSSSMRRFPIHEINAALGETKTIQSILDAIWDEGYLITDIIEEDDVIDPMVDGWTRRLVEEQRKIVIKDMFEEDKWAREKEVVEAATQMENNTFLFSYNFR